MSRIRVIALSMGLVIAALLANSVSEAQGPGGGRGGRGGGPGGFGGFGGFGGGGLVSLATRPGVQVELKLTEKQKTDVAALAEKLRVRVEEQRQRMREMFSKNGRGGRGGENNGDAATTDTTTAKSGTGSTKGKADAKGKLADAKGKTGKATAKGKAAPGGQGGPGDFRAMFEKQRQDDEAALAKILNPTQRARLAQIDLQQQGPYAFATPDLQKKLRMTPNQVADVEGIMQEARDAQRNGGNGGNNNGGQGNRGFGGQGNFGPGGGQGNGGPGGQRNRGQGGQDNGGQGGQGNGGQGGQGNRGRGGQGFDREAFQKKMEDPQFKAEMEQRRAETQARQDEIRDQMMAMIAGVLSKNQKVAYNKMRGEPFDRAKLDRNYDPSTAKEEAPKASSSKKKTAKSKKTA